MTVYVLLTNDHGDGTVLVACPDMTAANEVIEMTIWREGGVSGFVVPEQAATDWEQVRDILRSSGGMNALKAAALPQAAREAAASRG